MYIDMNLYTKHVKINSHIYFLIYEKNADIS